MSVMTIKLSRAEGAAWGFRLQGGKDFATPLCIQKVNSGSVAAVAGLQAGDAIVTIGGRDALALRHKEAQEAIVRAGNTFDLVVQRGSQTWKPQVTPLAQVKTTPEGVPVATKTSLAANKQVNGQQIVNAQYNTPLNLYSEDNIAETLSAQAEVLGKGCLGVNFMKNAPDYDGKTSDVLRMVQEMDKSPAPEHEDGPVNVTASGPAPGPAGTRSVRAPETKVNPPGAPSPVQLNVCSECERPLTGVFVRIKNKNLHADCFKCSTCGSSLKNVGYYNINEKLYCDVHAKQAARHHAPGPNLEPVVVKPGAPLPSGAMTAPMAKVAAAPYKPPVGGVRIMPSSPFGSTSAPMPKFAPVPPPKPAPIRPAPVPVQAPAAPMAAPPSTFTPFKAPAAPAPQKVPAPFGAPAGGVDVRTHIPKKGVSAAPPRGSGSPFVWPPPKKVDTVEEGPRTPSWAPAGDPFNVPRPKYIAGPLPKFPPLLPTPPPPKDYEIVIISSHPTQPSADPAKPSPASAASAPSPASAPTATPACKLPATNGVGNIAPSKSVPINRPAPKQPTAKPASAAPKPVPAKPTASKPIKGYMPVAAPKLGPQSAPYVGYKPVSSAHKGSAHGAPSRLASAPIPPPASVPIVNSAPAPAPKRAPGPAPAFASIPVPKPAAPKPPAPTDPAPVFAPAMPKPSPMPDLGGIPVKGAPTSGQRSAPRRGKGVMNPSTSARIPICADCNRQIRGPFVSALGKTWCPDHFVCSTASCRHALIDMGFVEEQGALHCEDCYEKYLAPICGKCDKRVKGDCLNAVGKQFHPECFCCAYCGKVFGSGAFYLEDGLPYCEADWNDLFTTKCVGCGFPIEAGDRWVEALNNNYHSQCFKCSKCHKNLEGQSFFAKGGKPFCKAHAQRGI